MSLYTQPAQADATTTLDADVEQHAVNQIDEMSIDELRMQFGALMGDVVIYYGDNQEVKR